MIIDLKDNKQAMQIICMAIGKEHDLISKMENVDIPNKDSKCHCYKEVILTVGGIELNFENVVRRINENFNRAVNERAESLINMKFENIKIALDELEESINDKIYNLEAE